MICHWDAVFGTEHSTPSPVAQCKSLFTHNNAAAQTHLSLKGASKWKTFSLISPQRYNAETPHEFNNLTSFLNRIWIKLSESFSQLKIGQFLSVLDQNLIFSDTLLFTGGKLVSNGTLISPIYFMQYMVTLSWLSVVLTVILEVFLTVRPQQISRHLLVTYKIYSSNWLCFITH